MERTSEFWKGFDFCWRHTNYKQVLQEKLLAEIQEENQFLRKSLNLLIEKEVQDEKSNQMD